MDKDARSLAAPTTLVLPVTFGNPPNASGYNVSYEPAVGEKLGDRPTRRKKSKQPEPDYGLSLPELRRIYDLSVPLEELIREPAAT